MGVVRSGSRLLTSLRDRHFLWVVQLIRFQKLMILVPMSWLLSFLVGFAILNFCIRHIYEAHDTGLYEL